MIGDTTHYLCEHNLRVQVSPFVYICLDMLSYYTMKRDIMYMYTINKLLLLLCLGSCMSPMRDTLEWSTDGSLLGMGDAVLASILASRS